MRVTSTVLWIGWLLVGGACSSARETDASRPPELGPPTRHLDMARRAGIWLENTSVVTEHGVGWQRVPDAGGAVVHDLYSGSSGVVLFLLELHHATGDQRWLDLAVRGGGELVHQVKSRTPRSEPGLYTGTAGMLVALAYLANQTGDLEFVAAYDHGLKALRPTKGSERQPRWSESTDVISGDAGVGMFMLWAGTHPVGEALDSRFQVGSFLVATGVAQSLLELRQPGLVGVEWPMRVGYPRAMPNYSHGTAGVVAFLAAVCERAESLPPQARERLPLDDLRRAAVAGGESLLAQMDGRGFIAHHRPGGEDLFYLSWCHGPPGTSRAFEMLFRLTGDARWQDAARAPAAELTTAGLPAERLPGLWNNVGPCCGTAGVGDYVLRLDPALQDAGHRAFCERLADDMLTRATETGDGLRWLHAEHRVRPDLLQAQTGYAQGAAGIGLWLLHLDGALRGRPPLVVFPDHPAGMATPKPSP